MALKLATFALALICLRIELSSCYVVQGKVSCLDCDHTYDFSGFKVLVKCDQVKTLGMALTEEDGSFKAQLPLGNPMSTQHPNCLAKLLGGPNQVYASRKNITSKIIKTHGSKRSYTISTPLVFSSMCPSKAEDVKCKVSNEVGASKTVDLPLPPEWGFPPTSDFVPFIPIIGIP